MKRVSLGHAKARLSNLVDEVMSGEMVEISRHGRPVAVLVPIEAARKIESAGPRPNFGLFLLTFPGPLEIGPAPSPMDDAV